MSEFMDVEPEPEESQSMALAKTVAEGDPELMLAHLEKKAKTAVAMKRAVEHILLAHTYPADWTIQGDGDKAKACLSSAGAERVARSFPIVYSGVKWAKEEFEDTNGKAYRYSYEGYAELYGRRVYVHGSYSTRDKFLGFANKEWRSKEEINEGHIRNAAYHVFCGNAVKELLGLRGMPAAEYQRIMQGTGQDGKKSQTVTRGQGTQGGTSADDSKHQSELAKICMEIANMGRTVAIDDGGNYVLTPLGEADERTPLDVAREICKVLSGFKDKKTDKWVEGKDSAKALKGKWLEATRSKAKELHERLNATPQDDLGF